MKRKFEVEMDLDGRLRPMSNSLDLKWLLAVSESGYCRSVNITEKPLNTVVEDGQANNCAEKYCNIYLSCTNPKSKQCYKTPATKAINRINRLSDQKEI